MKLFKNITQLLLIVILLSSCEKKYFIAKTFIDENNEKPIPGLLVGLYKWNTMLSWDTPIDSLKLISSAKTDSMGRVVFELKDEFIQSYLFLPVYISDSSSVNAKFHYKMKNGNYPTAGWGSNEIIYMYPYYDITLRLIDYIGDNTLFLKYENQVAFSRYNSNYYYFDITLRPGESHKLQFYKKNNTEDVFIEEKSVYVKFNNYKNRYLFDLPTSNLDIKLEQ